MATQSDVHVDQMMIRRNASGAFTVAASSGTPRIVCSTLDEALERAERFASQQHLHRWYTPERLKSSPLVQLHLLRKIWREYVEMPGLRLTCQQAQRLWAADAATCYSVLESLIELEFLVCSPDDQYARLAEADHQAARPPMTKAQLDAGHATGTSDMPADSQPSLP